MPYIFLEFPCFYFFIPFNMCPSYPFLTPLTLPRITDVTMSAGTVNIVHIETRPFLTVVQCFVSSLNLISKID